MTGRHATKDPSHQPRRDRMASPHVTDPYRERGKWPEPTVCPTCRAVFHEGRWQWGAALPNSEEHLCPACARIRDRVPAGQLTLSGEFFAAHCDEILNLVRNMEEQAKALRPLERIIESRDEGANTIFTFTDSHLAQHIGKALHSAYHGELDSKFTDEGDLMRVAWRR